MPKLRKLAPEYHRSTAEYVLMAVILGLFLLGLWSYFAARENLQAVRTVETTYEPGTPEEIDRLAEQETQVEQAASESADELEYQDSAAIESAADSMGGAFDETTY